MVVVVLILRQSSSFGWGKDPKHGPWFNCGGDAYKGTEAETAPSTSSNAMKHVQTIPIL
jgi:hypothetical protein